MATIQQIIEKIKDGSIKDIDLFSLDFQLNVDLQPQDVVDLAAALKAPGCVVNTLGLHSKYLGVDGAKALAEAIKDNKTITKIDISCNDIKDEGSIAIAQALQTNKTITEIKLSNNNIGVRGAEAIADALKINKIIKVLYLTNNNIQDAGAKAFAETLRNNKTLVLLCLTQNNIGNNGVKSLAHTIRNTSCGLTWLYLMFNHGLNIETAGALESAGWHAHTGNIPKNNKSIFKDLKTFASEHKSAFIFAGVAACALVVMCYKKPEILINAKQMFVKLFDKGSVATSL